MCRDTLITRRKTSISCPTKRSIINQAERQINGFAFIKQMHVNWTGNVPTFEICKRSDNFEIRRPALVGKDIIRGREIIFKQSNI
jgi:hypothetical protein